MGLATCADRSQAAGTVSLRQLVTCNAVPTDTAKPVKNGLKNSGQAFKDFFMATLKHRSAPLIRLLTAMGALTSILLLGILNFVS